jgi:hypothetical protein
MPHDRAFALLLERGEQMKWPTTFLLLGLAACTNHAHQDRAQQRSSKPVALPSRPTAQSARAGNASMEMKLIPIPKDKAQLARLLAMGYTVHRDHMHPPGVNSCPFDKSGGSVIE